MYLGIANFLFLSLHILVTKESINNIDIRIMITIIMTIFIMINIMIIMMVTVMITALAIVSFI